MHPGAIELRYTDQVTLERNVLHALGAGGIFLYDTRRTLVDGNALLEIGGIGIGVDIGSFTGGISKEGEIEAPRPGNPRSSEDTITNNRIQRFALDYWSAAGILMGFPWKLVVAHNEVREGDGSGIHKGWYNLWTRCHKYASYPKALPPDRCQTATGRNRFIGNSVSKVCTLIDDCGAIYTLGHQSPTNTFEDGLQIRGNHVFNMTRPDPWLVEYGSIFASLYLDGDTTYTVIADNIFEQPWGGVGTGVENYPMFLNNDEQTSVPPHNLVWSDAGALVPAKDLGYANQLKTVGDNVADPNQKPHVRGSAGLSPGYEDVPSL